MVGYFPALIAWGLTQTAGASEILPPAVHIAVFQQCDDKVSALSKEDLTAQIPASECKNLDTDRMKELGIDDCEHLRNEVGRPILVFHCGETVAKQAAEKCGKAVDDDCVDKVSDGVDKWSAGDAAHLFGEEKAEEGTEEMLAMVVACGDAIKEALKGDAPFDKWCEGATGDVSTDNLKKLGVRNEHCVKQTKKLFGAQEMMMCAEPPHDVKPADVTADKIKDLVKERVQHLQDEASEEDGHFQEEADSLMAVEQARLRLYQVAAKGWPTKVHGLSMKSVAVPGAALATMMVAVLFTYGIRRRHLRTVDLGDEMREFANSEESPE